jgi:hypothetical protein
VSAPPGRHTVKTEPLSGSLVMASVSAIAGGMAERFHAAGFRHVLERACSQSPSFKMWCSEAARIGGRREVIRSRREVIRSRVIRSRREVARIGGRREVIRSRREVIRSRREVIRSRREVIRR